MEPHLAFTLSPPSFSAYNELRTLVGWARIPDMACRQAFESTILFSCCFAADELIGFGRVVGDGAIYFYIQDVMVAPHYQRSGIGSTIVRELLKNLGSRLGPHSFLGLLAIQGTEKFYHRLNFNAIDSRQNTAMQWIEAGVDITGD